MASKINYLISNSISFLFALLGVSILFASFFLGWGNLKDPAPGMYPGILGGMMVFFSIICFFNKTNTIVLINIQRKGLIRVSFILCSLFFWVLAMPYCGYILGTFISTAIISQTLSSSKHWKFALPFSVFLTLTVYFLFGQFFYLDLPRGFLGK